MSEPTIVFKGSRGQVGIHEGEMYTVGGLSTVHGLCCEMAAELTTLRERLREAQADNAELRQRIEYLTTR